jgi:hypothetical protein
MKFQGGVYRSVDGLARCDVTRVVVHIAACAEFCSLEELYSDRRIEESNWILSRMKALGSKH